MLQRAVPPPARHEQALHAPPAHLVTASQLQSAQARERVGHRHEHGVRDAGALGQVQRRQRRALLAQTAHASSRDVPAALHVQRPQSPAPAPDRLQTRVVQRVAVRQSQRRQGREVPHLAHHRPPLLAALRVGTVDRQRLQARTGLADDLQVQTVQKVVLHMQVLQIDELRGLAHREVPQRKGKFHTARIAESGDGEGEEALGLSRGARRFEVQVKGQEGECFQQKLSATVRVIGGGYIEARNVVQSQVGANRDERVSGEGAV